MGCQCQCGLVMITPGLPEVPTTAKPVRLRDTSNPMHTAAGEAPSGPWVATTSPSEEHQATQKR